jgi:hypothetical protein
MEEEGLASMNRLLSENKLDGNIDLAIMGRIRGFTKQKHYAIFTEYPTEIVEYLEEAGINLSGAK